MLCEFHVPARTRSTVSNFATRARTASEAQFLDPVDVRIARIFRQDMDATRTPREMAIGWAEEERKAIEKGND